MLLLRTIENRWFDVFCKFVTYENTRQVREKCFEHGYEMCCGYYEICLRCYGTTAILLWLLFEFHGILGFFFALFLIRNYTFVSYCVEVINRTLFNFFRQFFFTKSLCFGSFLHNKRAFLGLLLQFPITSFWNDLFVIDISFRGC